MEEKQIQEHQGHVQQALKCPRCDSSNTKFCYYNNYSLSQPRHFCKACKRYWTRGGTLRNVPVGGGYRKNKRVKKGNSIVDHHREISSSSSHSPVVNPSGVQSASQGVDTSLLSTRSHIDNPLLYSLLTNNRSEVNLPYSIRDGYGLNLPQFKVGGNGELGFSSVTSQKAGDGELGFSSVTSQKVTSGELGFSSVTSQNMGLSGTDMSLASLTHPLLFSTYPIYGTSTSTPTMASMASSQQKIVSNGYNDLAQTPYGFMGLDDLQMLKNNEGYDMLSKDAKMEGHGSWFDSQTNQNYIQEINSLDQSFMWNSSAGAGVRPNPSNIGC